MECNICYSWSGIHRQNDGAPAGLKRFGCFPTWVWIIHGELVADLLHDSSYHLCLWIFLPHLNLFSVDMKPRGSPSFDWTITHLRTRLCRTLGGNHWDEWWVVVWVWVWVGEGLRGEERGGRGGEGMGWVVVGMGKGGRGGEGDRGRGRGRGRGL